MEQDLPVKALTSRLKKGKMYVEAGAALVGASSSSATRAEMPPCGESKCHVPEKASQEKVEGVLRTPTAQRNLKLPIACRLGW